MKLYALDWNEVLGALPRWEALSPDARRAFLRIEPGQTFALGPLGKAGKELEKAGLLIAPTGRGTQYGLDPGLRPLLLALRAADRVNPVAGADGRLREAYVTDQLTVMQVHRIARPQASYHTAADSALAASAASSAAWVRGFLSAETHRKRVKWEEQRLSGQERPRLAFTQVGEALREIVQALAARPTGVYLRSLAGLVPHVKPDAVASALGAGLRYLLVFVSVTRDAEAVVGLLPAVAARLAGTLAPPAPVQARETFVTPYRVGDMTALLVEAATEPIPIRAADHSLYVRPQRAIAARLAGLPGWVAQFAHLGMAETDDEDDYDEPGGNAPEGESDEDALRRVELAVSLASKLGLAAVKRAGTRSRLEATRAGRAWLARGEGERLKDVLTALRKLRQPVPTAYGTDELEFFGAPLGFQLGATSVDARAALSTSFLSTPPGALVSIGEFARYHGQEHNPFLGKDGPIVRARGFWGNEPSTVEAWEDVWGTLLLAFLARRLVPLGCATLGRTDDGAGAFTLTDAGRYLLGARDDFALAPAAEGGEVVVQPDFEIVFLAPAPRAEAELGRIAERTGAGVGALFRLTRASVLRAAEQGMSTANVLETLETVSRGGVPANVARQVRDWMKAIRTIRIAPAVLVHCPDAETAARVRALGGALVAEVTPTLLRLEADAKARAALVKRLRDKGIFVGSG